MRSATRPPQTASRCWSGPVPGRNAGRSRRRAAQRKARPCPSTHSAASRTICTSVCLHKPRDRPIRHRMRHVSEWYPNGMVCHLNMGMIRLQLSRLDLYELPTPSAAQPCATDPPSVPPSEDKKAVFALAVAPSRLSSPFPPACSRIGFPWTHLIIGRGSPVL
jgi:hypothetical protein